MTSTRAPLVFAGLILVAAHLIACGDTSERTPPSETGDGDGDGGITGDGDGDGDITGDGDGDGDSGCDDVSDCQLVEDCCTCDAIHVDTEPLACPDPCDQTACAAIGLTNASAACRLGGCALAAVQCSGADCAEVPPDCPDGLHPQVMDGCWTGDCVPARLCAELPSCDETICGEGFFCLETQSGAGAPRCEPLPSACAGELSCECLTPWFAEVCPGSCSASGGTILCEDGG